MPFIEVDAANSRGTVSGMLRITPFLTLLCVAVGCASKLETGYVPQRLGASATERRAFYASPYTPEANAAAEDKAAELDARRPRSGY